MDSIPLIVISGQVQSHLIGTDSFQETDMMGISRPVVKHSFNVQETKDIPRIVQEAFHIATTGRPGPVVIDIPKDKTDPSKHYQYTRLKEVFAKTGRSGKMIFEVWETKFANQDGLTTTLVRESFVHRKRS